MDLLRALEKAGASWSLEVGSPSESSQKRAAWPPVVGAITFKLPTMEQPFAWKAKLAADCTLQEILGSTLRRADRENPLYKEYRQSLGHTTVRLVPDVLENIPEAVHTALRKCADSTQSSITWNAIHKLHPSDRGVLWATIKASIEKVFADEAKPTRLALATRLSQDVKDAMDARDLRDGGARYDAETEDDPDSPRLSRSQRELCAYALMTLRLGMDLTSMEEWMWGWLGFVVEDCPEPASPEVAA